MFRISPWWQICFYYTTVLAFTYFLVFADDTVAETGELTLCSHQSENPRSLIFVSTLDGKITAFDANNHGEKQWTLDFKNGPILSSNIHRRELNNNGQWIRLIPSLSGSLYKFNGETLETIPISTNQLLHSSFRYSDDLVFSGGKELHSYAVSASTGTVLYECGVNKCKNETAYKEYLKQDILIIQRFQQTIRAIETRTGIERWNFSVGQYELVLIPATDVYCPNKITNLDIEIKGIIPKGLIWAVNKSNPDVKLWQYKFDSPIVTIWREDLSKVSMNQVSLEQINLFDGSQWHWGSNHPKINPNLYVGMHERQLYVQESVNIKNMLDISPKNTQHTKYPWHPYPAIATALITTLPNNNNKDNNNEVFIETNEVQSTTALSVLYNSEYINGNGFYLYSKDQLSENTQCNRSDIMLKTENPMVIYTEEENAQIMVSLWFWWREVLVISITSAFILNIMLSQRLFNITVSVNDGVVPPLITKKPVEKHVEIEKNDLSNDKENPNNFKSRYLTDFEPVDCLGKGGYGIVFEAKNKIDDCNYAIKRIALPNSRDSRERVMREVKALAKLDHQNIVRYFNAWLECPPKGWQEEHDQQWITKLKLSSSRFLSEVTHTTTEANDSVCIDVSQTDTSSVDSACEIFELNNVQTNDDSFVVFERSTSNNQYDNDAIYINDGSADKSDVSFSSNAIEKKLMNIKMYSMNDTNSESIIFEESNNDDDTAKKNGKRKRQQSLSLNLKNKFDDYKTEESPKMFLYIQMQLCQRFSLRKWLKQYTSARDPLWVLNIFQQIVDAVEYVHLQGLIHRDLKPSNIFFALDDKIKIGDFGLVTAMTEGYDGAHTPASEDENTISKNTVHTACVGTHLYMSPEQMNGQIYNYKVDIYSLGIIFFELLTPFFTDMERIMALSNLKKSIFPKDFATNYPAEYNLLKMMLDQDPAKRPTTLGIKARPPLQNYEIADGFSIDKDSKWHFELPQMTRQFSVTGNCSNSNELIENMS